MGSSELACERPTPGEQRAESLVPPPAAVVIRRRARPGRDAALAAVVQAMMLAARAFPGHMSSDMIRLRAPAGEWLLILRFDSPSALHRWASSGITLEWWAQAERLTQPAQVDRAHGRENWSTLPGRVDAPPRWKMALATALGIYPLVLFLFPLLAAFAAGLPSWLAGLVTVAVAISLMTWGVMPLLTCLLRGWLFGHPSAGAPVEVRRRNADAVSSPSRLSSRRSSRPPR